MRILYIVLGEKEQIKVVLERDSSRVESEFDFICKYIWACYAHECFYYNYIANEICRCRRGDFDVNDSPVRV